jgi:hypothetical protein
MSKKMEICPWCRNPEGERGIGSEDRTVMGSKYKVFFGECECGARGPHADSADQAEDEWNSSRTKKE